MKREKEGTELAIVKFTECGPLLEALNDAISCMCMLYTAAEIELSETDVDRLEKGRNCVAVEEKSEGSSFESVLCTGHVVRADSAVHLLIAKLTCSSQRLYSDRLFGELARRKKRVHGHDSTH